MRSGSACSTMRPDCSGSRPSDRLRILTLLHRGEEDVSSLREALDVPAANVSQHLALLRSRHVVAMRRQGTRIFYALRDLNSPT